MTSGRGYRKRMMLSALSAALLFYACTDDIIKSTIIPIGTNESYAVSDTAIVYNIANDTAHITITYLLENDTVRQTIVRHSFDDSQQAQFFFNSNYTDDDLQSFQLDNRSVEYSISNCNGLSALDVVNILKGEYLYDEAHPDTLTGITREFSIRSFDNLSDGMYFMLSRKDGDGRQLFRRNSLKGEWHGMTYAMDSTQTAWRLWRAPDDEGWIIQLCNGSYLRRSGNRTVPMVMNATPDVSMATSWRVDDVVKGLNFWTLHTAISKSSDFYGVSTEEGNTLKIVLNTLENYALLVNHVKLTFMVSGETWQVQSSVWGSHVSLPYYTDVHDGATFIGWNTAENTVEGYLTPGTTVEADNTVYYAVFVKTE